MRPETILLTLVGLAVGAYAVAVLVGYLRRHWTQLVLSGETGDVAASPAQAAPAAPPVRHAGAHAHADEILRNWFAGKHCAICERPIPPIHRGEQHPGMMNTASATHDIIAWEDIPHDAQLSALLGSHAPVCSNCVLTETFRRKFPELVLDRPEHSRHVH